MVRAFPLCVSLVIKDKFTRDYTPTTYIQCESRLLVLAGFGWLKIANTKEGDTTCGTRLNSKERQFSSR